MGCDLVPMIPDDENCIAMSYSTFNRLRTNIVNAYLLSKGYDIEEEKDFVDEIGFMLGITTAKMCQKMGELLKSLKDDVAQAMLEFLLHCDCDGIYESELCGLIAEGIDQALTVIDKESPDFDMIEGLRDVFKYTYEKDGVLAVC